MISVKILIAILIALLVIIPLCGKGMGFLKLNYDYGSEAMEDLDEMMIEMQSESTLKLDNRIIELDDGDGFFFLNKTSDEVRLTIGAIPRAIKRPLLCDLGKSCFCYCNELVKTDGAFLSNEEMYVCVEGELRCSNYDIDFEVSDDAETFFNKTLKNTDVRLEGGFFLLDYSDIYIPLVNFRNRLVMEKDTKDKYLVCIRKEGGDCSSATP
ncbi:hypothetical protein N9934_01135 [Desulfosarcina sp.]|nr:hypothetical protein [Desulfosarcina sp.]